MVTTFVGVVITAVSIVVVITSTFLAVISTAVVIVSMFTTAVVGTETSHSDCDEGFIYWGMESRCSWHRPLPD